MTGKKKLWAALATLALVLVVAGASVGITFAALSGTVTSNFTVKYTASNVEATLTGKYSVNSGTNFTDLTTGDSDTSIAYTTSTTADESTKSFNAVSDANFASATDYVLVVFAFTNDSQTYDLNVVLTFTSNDNENVDIAYAWHDNGTNEPTSYQTLSDTTLPAQKVDKATSESEKTTKYLYVKASIHDNIKAATFKGNFSFALANA